MQLNAAEKCFALLCNKNVAVWGAGEKSKLSRKELLTLQMREWDDFWNRMSIPCPDFRGKTAVDYGCGFGYDSLFALQQGAEHIYCLEVSQARLDGARELHASYGFENATYIDNTDVESLPAKIGRPVDVVFSRDVMEHVPSPQKVLESMFRVAKPGAEIYIGFSPFYKSPYGPHFKNLCKIPWIHLFFSEKTVLNVFKQRYGLPQSITSYQEIEGSGVNKLSYYDYKKMLGDFAWSRQADLINRFPRRRWAEKLLNFLVKITPSRNLCELFIVSSYVCLRKSPSLVVDDEYLTSSLNR